MARLKFWRQDHSHPSRGCGVGGGARRRRVQPARQARTTAHVAPGTISDAYQKPIRGLYEAHQGPIRAPSRRPKKHPIPRLFGPRTSGGQSPLPHFIHPNLTMQTVRQIAGLALRRVRFVVVKRVALLDVHLPHRIVSFSRDHPPAHPPVSHHTAGE